MVDIAFGRRDICKLLLWIICGICEESGVDLPLHPIAARKDDSVGISGDKVIVK
jgi:hypothetical protein